MSDLLAEVVEGVGRLTLNRPAAINSLTQQMCDGLLATLSSWAIDHAVVSVELRGAGERGFCSGADVRQLRERAIADPVEARTFFDIEYALNALLAEYPKPVTSYMSGITMGGGMGLTMHTSNRIADQTTVISMPETTIGLFPDVGSLYELSRAPGEAGTYLALAGAHVDADSARFAGLVDVSPGAPAGSALAQDLGWLSECFAGDDAVEIMARLSEHPSERANQVGAELATKCPLSVKVTLKAIRRAAHLGSVRQVLAQDYVLACNFMAEPDFAEGVRAQLVDKDRRPQWRHASVSEVPDSLVDAMFVS